jgi:hypothetical protein
MARIWQESEFQSSGNAAGKLTSFDMEESFDMKESFDTIQYLK